MNDALKSPAAEAAFTPLDQVAERGKWLALMAALLGWMFDGLEMGLFPLAGRPALKSLLHTDADQVIGHWFGVAMAAFLVGAATGGVVFGWLGDRIGRVRALSASVLCYALLTGASALVQDATQLVVLRFLAALGMGGEWSLGVALVNEIWPGRSRAFLAGLIGAAANVGFLLIGVVGMLVPDTPDSWRWLMLVGAAPALLTLMIQRWVPESTRWLRERGSGATGHWATRDLFGVLIGSAGACLIIVLWAGFSLNAIFGEQTERAASELSGRWGGLPAGVVFTLVIVGSLLGLVIATVGFLYPVQRYLQRHSAVCGEAMRQTPNDTSHSTIKLMLLGAGLSGVALLGTWGSIQWAPTWANALVHPEPGVRSYHKEWTQIVLGLGAIGGTILAALAGDWLGRRLTYCLLCVGSLGSVLALYQPWAEHVAYGPTFLFWAFVAGAVTASFYGWLPLYLPELFRTSVRATGQGFSFNFGRIIAAVGALQTGALTALLAGQYPQACAAMSLIYLAGVVLIWFAPETRGRPLPE